MRPVRVRLSGLTLLFGGLALACADADRIDLSPVAAADSGAVLMDLGYEQFGVGTREAAEAAADLFLEAAGLHRHAGQLPEAGEALQNVGFIRRQLGETESAFEILGEARETYGAAGDIEGQGEATLILGEMRHAEGNLTEALALYRQARELLMEAAAERGTGLANGNIGIALLDSGQADSALAYMNLALEAQRSIGDSLGQGVTLNNLGLAFQNLGQPDSALTYLTASLEQRRAVGDRPGEGYTLNNLGYNYGLTNQPDTALHHYRAAVDVWRELGMASEEGLALTNIGRAHLAMGSPDSALSYSSRGLRLKQEAGDRVGEAWALDDLGQVYRSLGRPDTALAYFQRALSTLREVGDRTREGITLQQLGWTYQGIGSQESLRSAVAYYDSAATVRATVAQRAGTDLNRVTFGEQDVELYERWALAWLALSPSVGAESATFAALGAAERGRAQALLDLLREGDTDASISNADQSVEELGRTLVADALEDAGGLLYYLVTSDTLLAWAATGPGTVVTHATPITRDSLAALVGGARLEWGVSDESLGSRFGGAQSSLIPQSEPQAGSTQRGTSVVARRSGPGAPTRVAAVVLPRELTEELPSEGDLVVVPNGPLNLLSFPGLTSTDSDEPLGVRLPLRHAPSLQALRSAQATTVRFIPGTQGSAEALVVGNPTMPTVTTTTGARRQLATLPGAELEGEQVAAVLEAQPLVAGFATETEVRETIGQASVVHLATHGFASTSGERARDSFIALAPDGEHDGLLTMGEVMDEIEPLQAELVVLSACQTGLGNLRQAEGTVGLQRAFLARGARSVLVSLWNVSDEATTELMTSFYRHWTEDPDRPSKASALMRAQQDLRAEGRFAEPRFWAAFQLIGAS